MATAATPRGKSVSIAFKDESTFGTAPSGNWTNTAIYSHSLEEKKPFENDPIIGNPRTNNRDQGTPADGLNEVSGDIVAPIDFNHIGWLLKGAFGAASVAGAGDPYTHTFTSGGEVLPHRSVEVMQSATLGHVWTGLLCNKLSFDVGRRAGYDRVTAEFMGKSETKLTSTGAGTPATAWAASPALAKLPIFKLGGTQVAYVTGLKAVYDNKASILDYLGSAYPSGHALDDECTFTGTIDVRFLDATLYDMAVANSAAFTGEILWSLSGSRSLSILANAMRFERAGVKVAGPGGISQTFNFRCEQSNAAAMLTTTLKSLVPAY